MRRLTPAETKLTTGAGFLDFAYLGTYVGFCSGMAAACAAPAGPIGTIVVGSVAGAAALGYFFPNHTTLGAVSGAVSGAMGGVMIPYAAAAGTPSPIICAGVIGSWLTMYTAAAIYSK